MVEVDVEYMVGGVDGDHHKVTPLLSPLPAAISVVPELVLEGRCGSASPTLEDFPNLCGHAELEIPHVLSAPTAESWRPCGGGGLVCDDILLEIMQRLDKDDVLALCVASGRTFGMAVWAVAQIHFQMELSVFVWRYCSAGMKAQVASEKFQAALEAYREASSTREMLMEDGHMQKSNPARYEMNLVTSYENEQLANYRQQAGLQILEDTMKCWDTSKLEKDSMESWVFRFFEKGHNLRICILASEAGFSGRTDTTLSVDGYSAAV